MPLKNKGKKRHPASMQYVDVTFVEIAKGSLLGLYFFFSVVMFSAVKAQ